MAIDAGFDCHELDALAKTMYKIAEENYPKEVKVFLRKQAGEGTKLLRAETKAVTKKKTGNLRKGIRKGPPKKYRGDWQIRVYNKAPHAHLIEHGHAQRVKGRVIEKYVPGRHPAAKTTRKLKSDFPREVEKFVDHLIEEGFEL